MQCILNLRRDDDAVQWSSWRSRCTTRPVMPRPGMLSRLQHSTSSACDSLSSSRLWLSARNCSSSSTPLSVCNVCLYVFLCLCVCVCGMFLIIRVAIDGPREQEEAVAPPFGLALNVLLPFCRSFGSSATSIPSRPVNAQTTLDDDPFDIPRAAPARIDSPLSLSVCVLVLLDLIFGPPRAIVQPWIFPKFTLRSR